MAKIKRVELLPEDNLDRGTYIDHPKGDWVLVPYEKWQRIFYRDEPMPDLQLDVIEAVDERRAQLDEIVTAGDTQDVFKERANEGLKKEIERRNSPLGRRGR